MRKNILRFIFRILFTLSVLFSIAGCRQPETIRIGVSQCSDDDWRQKMNEEIRREVMFRKGVEVEIVSADDDSRTQIDQIRRLIDDGIDILIAAPNEADALTPVIKEIHDKGIPVLLFDRNIHGESYTAFQGADNDSIGHQAALMARNLGRGDARVIQIRGLMGSTPARDREKGFLREASERGGITILASADANWDADIAGQKTDSLLRLYPEANIIYAHNDRMAIAASRAAERLGVRDRVKIIGVDAAPAIGLKAVADTVIDATFLYPTEGNRLIRTALDIIEGKKVPRHTFLPSSGTVDLSNAEILLIQNRELNEETARVNGLKTQIDDYWDRHSAQTVILYLVGGIGILLAGLLFLLLRAFWTNRETQRQLARKNQELDEQNNLLSEQRDRLETLNGQLREVTQSKLTFFTNVSHDFRTPLTLIAGPVESLSGAPNLNPEQQSMVAIARKNVKVLMRLINQILDFRKFENGRLDVRLSESDLGELVRDWTDAFRAVAAARDIRYEVEIPDNTPLLAAIDVDKIERVVFNLISNAFKHTQPRGKITVTLRIDDNMASISVADTGTGISAADLPHIFERFFQADKTNPEGSGIGLALAKAFMELHDGTLTVQSTEGEGSVFTASFPVRHVDGEIRSTAINVTPAQASTELGILPESTDVPEDDTTILVIDDNPDLRTYLSASLAPLGKIITAPDGRQGLALAAKYVPDVIVCDVMMPVMDGLETTRRIKAEATTSHIPVLLLTACSLDEQRVAGYDSGADGYISKPFSDALLQSRIRALMANRRLISDAGRNGEPEDKKNAAEPKKSDLTLSPDGLSKIDSEFYARTVKAIDERLKDPDLTIDDIAAAMGLGRTQFYRKIKALTNYSPVELLRNRRLAAARELLISSEKTIAEIGYETGFSSPAYFAKCFRDRYAETPSDLRERILGK